MPRRIGSHHVDLGATRELLPGIVSDSWLRSERLGLRRDDQAAPVLPLADLTTAREQNRWISHQAQPQLLNLLPVLKNSPAIIVMSDARGLVLDTLGNVAWQSLFNHRPGQHAAPVEACNNRRYQARQQTHQTARVTVPPVQEAVHPQALRLLNAGIALCITGETGSGKEHLCRALHQQSQWRNGPFVAINCAAVPENLIESELFGYVPGAFTGANPKGYEGKLREANNGVLFLDEIGDMPLAMQTRLLRVLQEKCVTPLGGNGRHNVNFALVCATHRDLQQCVAEGTFREDLLYRIQEFQLRLPPLREKADLAAFILTLWAQLGGTTRRITLSESLLATLSRLPWPGNVRQLLSFLKVLLALHDDGDVIDEETLPDGIVCPGLRVERATVSSAPPPDELAALREANGNMTLAARQLGISRSTLYRRLERRNAV